MTEKTTPRQVADNEFSNATPNFDSENYPGRILVLGMSIMSFIVGIVGSFYGFAGAWAGVNEMTKAYLTSGLCFFIIGAIVAFKCDRFHFAPFVVGSVASSLLPLMLMSPQFLILGLLPVWLGGGLGHLLGSLRKKS